MDLAGPVLAFDLRAELEVAYNGPDALPAGVTLHATPVHDEGNRAAAPHEQPKELTKEIVDAALEHAYSRFPTLDGAQTALAYAIRLVADSTGGVLIHCAAGKDRAGWIIAALLRAAGIADADILADYLRSNDAIEHLRAIVISRNGDLTHVSDKVLGVDDDFIRAAWRVVDTDFGGFDNYLDMIGVDDLLLARLRSRLLD